MDVDDHALIKSFDVSSSGDEHGKSDQLFDSKEVSGDSVVPVGSRNQETGACSAAKKKFQTVLTLKLNMARIRPTKAMSCNAARNESPGIEESPRTSSPETPRIKRAPISVRLENITKMSPSDMKDRYRNLRCWGAGAYGKVFRAFDRKKARSVAIKYIEVNEEAEVSEKLMKSLKTEITILTRCAKESRYITRLYNTYHNNEGQFDCFWIVMEFCDFGSLKDLIDILIKENAVLAEAEIAMIAASVLKGLICLHKNSIIHRDIKPGNILLTSTGWCKLADFGVSADLGRQKDDMRRTFAGTVSYWAPEVAAQRGYSYPADVWSLAATISHLATREAPFTFLRVASAVAKLRAGNIKIPELPGLTWSDHFRRWLATCFKKNPRERPSLDSLSQHPFALTACRQLDQNNRKPLVDLVLKYRPQIDRLRGRNRQLITPRIELDQVATGINSLAKTGRGKDLIPETPHFTPKHGLGESIHLGSLLGDDPFGAPSGDNKAYTHQLSDSEMDKLFIPMDDAPGRPTTLDFDGESKLDSETTSLLSPDELEKLTIRMTAAEEKASGGAVDEFAVKYAADVPLAVADHMKTTKPSALGTVASNIFSPMQVISKVKTTMMRLRSKNAAQPEKTSSCYVKTPRNSLERMRYFKSPRDSQERMPSPRDLPRSPRSPRTNRKSKSKPTAKPLNYGRIVGRRTDKSEDNLAINPSYSVSRGERNISPPRWRPNMSPRAGTGIPDMSPRGSIGIPDMSPRGSIHNTSIYDISPRVGMISPRGPRNKYKTKPVRLTDFGSAELTVRPTHSASRSSKRKPLSPDFDAIKSDNNALRISPQKRLGRRGKKLTDSPGVVAFSKPNQSENDGMNQSENDGTSPRSHQQKNHILAHAPGIPNGVANIYGAKLIEVGPGNRKKRRGSNKYRVNKPKPEGKGRTGKVKDSDSTKDNKEERVMIPEVLGSPDDGATVIEPKIGLITFGSKTYTTVTPSKMTAVKGKAFYEITLHEVGRDPQIGWIAPKHFENPTGDGVGDDAASWGVDGVRKKKFHNSRETNYRIKWHKGDTIGMAADLDRGTISVGHNGKFRPIWQNISTPRKRGDPKDARVKIDGGLAPALSGSDGIVCTLNTGQKPWKYGPPHPDYKAFKDVAVPYKIAWDVEKTPAPASKEAKAALAAASAAAVAAAKFSRSIRAPSIHPQEWTTNVSKYIEARMKLEAETHIPKSKREETSVKSLVEGQVKMYDLPTPEDSTDCAWKIMKEFDTRIARVQVLSRMLMGSKDRVEIRGLRSGRVVLRFGLFPNKTEKDEFGIVRNCIKKYTMEVRVFARNMGLAPESPSHAKNADKVGKTQVETHTEALKAERQQLIAQEHRRRSLSAATAAHAKLDWISAFATSE